MNVVVLAGGTGGAKLAAAIQSAAPGSRLTVIANTADDDVFWGWLVCPDIDAVIYRLAGVFNDRAGYGVKDDSFHVLEALARIGAETWFRLGDADIATHLVRDSMLRAGRTLTEASLELGRRFGISAEVLPMTNETVRTRFSTNAGELSFQEYFVRERLEPRLKAIRFAGIDSATPSEEVVAAIANADRVVIGPSNPLISVAPILELTRKHLRRERTWAVTPIIAGGALKGPTVEMMTALGPPPTPVEVARLYRDVASTFVLDERDAGLAQKVKELGYRTVVVDTVMRDAGRDLVRAVLDP